MKNLIILILTIFLSSCSFSTDYVLKIGNEKISKGEYLIYLMEQKKSFETQGGTDIWEADFDGVSAEEVAKQNALNTITVVKTAVKEAPNLNISLNDDELNLVNKQTDELTSEFSQNELEELELNRDKIFNIMKEVSIQQKVYKYITDKYTINEAQFQTYLEEYYNDHKSDYSKYIIKEIFIQPDTDGEDNKTKIEKAYNLIQKGANFDEISKSINPNISTEAVEIDKSLYTENTLSQIYSHTTGDIFFVDDIDGYHIFKIENIITISIEDVKEEIKQNYINQKKQSIYQEQNISWQGNLKIKKNDAIWNSISIVKS